MKKTIAVLLSALLVVALCACGGGAAASPVGSYAVKSMTMGGQTFTAEELEASGADLSAFTMELKDGGEFVLNVATVAGAQTVTGTWTAEGNKIALSAEGSTLEATLEGNVLTVSQEGAEMVFEK